MKNFDIMEKYSLTFAELKLLEVLLSANGDVVKKGDLYKAIGKGKDEYLVSRAVDVHICNLRKKISDEYKIFKARGIGYFMENSHAA